MCNLTSIHYKNGEVKDLTLEILSNNQTWNMTAGETMVCKRGSGEGSVFPRQSVHEHKSYPDLGVRGALLLHPPSHCGPSLRVARKELGGRNKVGSLH